MNYSTINPETLIVDMGMTSQEIFEGPEGLVDEIAKELANSSPVSLAILLEANQQLAREIVSDIEQVIVQKVWDATPDELEELVEQAKDNKVWNSRVKAAVQRRNQMQVRAIKECHNLEMLDTMLTAMARTRDGWLPASVYEAAKENLAKRIETATMTELDTISSLAGRWRVRHALLPAIKERDAALIRTLSRAEVIGGYVLKTGTRKQLIEKPRKALRLIDTGKWSAVER